MKLIEILKTAGSVALQTMLPGTGSLIVNAINELLPDDKALPVDATGREAAAAVAGLPADQKAKLLDREFDVRIVELQESNATVRAMLDADKNTKHTTRPRIALGSFRVVAFAVIIVVSIWAYGVIRGDSAMVSAVSNGWPFILTVLGPLVSLLWAYFGILKQERRDTLNAAAGNSPAVGLVSKLFNRSV